MSAKNRKNTARRELPVGFENKGEQVRLFGAAEQQKAQQQVSFGRRGSRNIGQVVEKPQDAKKTLWRLMKYFGQEKKLLILLVAAVLIVTGAALAAPSIQGNAIDSIAQKKWGTLTPLLIWLAIVYALNVGCTLAQTLVSAHLSQHIVKNMRHDLFEKIDNLSIGYLDTHSNGDIMSRMTNDVENISNTVSQSLGSLISGVLTIVGTVAIMFYYCWQLTLITMATVVLTVIVTKYMSSMMRKVYRKRSEVLGQLNGHSEEMITGYRTIVAYGKQDDVIAEFNKTSDELTKVGIRAEILGGSMGPIMNCISNISFVIVAAFGGYFALKGIITIGVISAFIIYAKQFSRPINEIAQLYGSVQTAIAGAERVFQLIDEPNEDKSGDLMLEATRGEISFRHIDFSYVPGKQVLFDFSLDIKPGQKIALVGSTGSGKTTVVNLLMRFYQQDAGEILLDGVDIREINRDELRKFIAIVLQDTVLFSDTIERNIKYAELQTDDIPDPAVPKVYDDEDAELDQRMINAARMSNSENFIELLPKKYRTVLRQAGANLSQGQRQLLSIARAILADPKILILDEATSSVDTRTERNIQDAMVNLMKNRTSLIIAHRLSTIKDADVIVVMDAGRVVEKGNHEELLAMKGRYYDLYMTQFEGHEI